MIVLGFVLLSLGWLLEYCGFTNTDPREEISSVFNGSESSAKGMQGGGISSPSDGTGITGGENEAFPPPGGGSMGRADKRTGSMAVLPLFTCTRPGIMVDRGIAPEVVRLCHTYNVRVSSGKSSAGHVANSDHRCGGAADFVGTTHNLKALYNYALTAGYAYVEPWKDSTTVGVLGTTGAHVHISFFRCAL
jgi:hypothetical protein